MINCNLKNVIYESKLSGKVRFYPIHSVKSECRRQEASQMHYAKPDKRRMSEEGGK